MNNILDNYFIKWFQGNYENDWLLFFKSNPVKILSHNQANI